MRPIKVYIENGQKCQILKFLKECFLDTLQVGKSIDIHMEKKYKVKEFLSVFLH